MPNVLYIGLQDEDKIAVFALDAQTGRLDRKEDVAAAGGPSVFAVSSDRKILYAGHRGQPAISSFTIDWVTGGLRLLGSVAQEHAPTFLAPDRTGRHLLCAYYQGGGAAVHPIGADGAVSGAAQGWLATATGAHAIATDRSNRFAFVPHIARLNDNVLEPPKNNPGPNFIMQFHFDAGSGRLTANTPSRVEQSELLGPRHFCFHPSLDILYFSNEQGSSVTAYALDPAAGTLSAMQMISTLPDGFTARNTCSQIHLTPSGRFLYVGNRGANCIAGFAVDPATGRLSKAGHAPTEVVPSAFALDPSGRFLYAAGTASGRLAAYRISGETGVLTPLAIYTVGQRPAAVATAALAA